MLPILLGVLMASAALSLGRSIAATRRPALNSRVGLFLPGFRPGRNQGDSTIWRLARSSISFLKNQLQEQALTSHRRQRALQELPDFLDLLAVATSAGESFYSAVRIITSRANGVVAEEFRRLVAAIEMGAALEDEMPALARRIRVRQIEELANKVLLSQRRGTPLSSMLQDHATAVRTEIQNNLLANAGRNETRMLIPLVFLILPVTILFAVYPSLQLLNFNYA